MGPAPTFTADRRVWRPVPLQTKAPAEPANPPDEAQAVRVALQALPEEERQIIERASCGGWTHGEIAEMLKLPPDTVKSHARPGLLKRRDALLWLRRRLGRRAGPIYGRPKRASDELGPTFARVELLRSDAVFLIVPVALYVTMLASTPTIGFKLSATILLALILLGGLLALAVLLLGGQRPHPPDLQPWLDGEP